MKSFISSLGPVCAIIGAQWGDEGKGKATDLLAGHFDVIARAGGGANAGHTIVVEGKKHVFHLLPSGCLHARKQIVLGTGMVIHLPTLLEEIDLLKKSGIDVASRLHISSAAHILFDFHKDIDAALEERRNKSTGGAIGTTRRGIGPAYMDKAARTGIRMAQLTDDLKNLLTGKKEEASSLYGVAVDIKKELRQLTEANRIIGKCITDTAALLHKWIDGNRTIVIEGAQGTLLDIDHGTYPYVTSSTTTVSGALQGLGLSPHALSSSIGVAKAYCTRVGSGTFPTEAEDKAGDRLRERGGEYGATTGRPRRCGWLCIDDLKKGAAINGFAHWNITKLDVLDEEDTIPISIGMDGDRVRYEALPGWKQSTVGIDSFDALPKNAQAFLQFIEERTGIPVSLIGTGPDRKNMIVRMQNAECRIENKRKV